MMRRLAVIALALAACVAAIPSRSDDYPSRPVRIVFGFGPGSSGDVMSRVLAQRMSQDLGQPFIVEGKPGANGQLGAAQVARAPNDGYTLFLASVSNATNVAITPASATDLAKELTPIALVATVPSILVVHPSLGVANVQELIALAKAKPGSLNYGSYGIGTYAHLSMEDFKQRTGTDIVHIPYRGAAPAATALLAGDVAMLLLNLSSIEEHEKTGKARILAAAGEKARRCARICRQSRKPACRGFPPRPGSRCSGRQIWPPSWWRKSTPTWPRFWSCRNRGSSSA